MNADFLNPFVYAGMKVLMAEAGVTNWSLEKPYLVQIDRTRNPISVVIGVTGAVQGLVVYGMDLAVAKGIVTVMTGMQIAITDPVAQSALGELGNLITGMASSALEETGYPCRISPPAIVCGTACRLTATTVPMVAVPMETGLGAVHIYLALGQTSGGQQGRSTA